MDIPFPPCTNADNSTTTTKDDDGTSYSSRDDPLSRGTQENQQENDDPALSIDDAIEQIGMGWFQYRILIAAGLSFGADANIVMCLSFITIILRKEWNLSEEMAASISSSYFAGFLIGKLVLGPLADKFGRWTVGFLSNFIAYFFALILVVWVEDYFAFLGHMFMVGFGIGGTNTPYVIFAECLPNAARGYRLLLIELSYPLGTMLVTLMAYWILPSHNGTGGLGWIHSSSHDDLLAESHASHEHWRYLMALSVQTCLLSNVLMYFWVPESPHWLCAQGRFQEALIVLQKAAKTNCGCISSNSDGMSEGDYILLVPNHLQLLSNDIQGNGEQEKQEASICDLFAPQWRNITLKTWGISAIYSFGYYGTMLAVTKIFSNDNDDNEVGPSTQNATEDTNLGMMLSENHLALEDSSASLNDQEAVDFDYGAIFTSSAADLFGIFLATLVVERLGRIPSQMAIYLVAGVVLFLLCGMANFSTLHMHWVVVLLAFLARVFEMSATCLSYVSITEVFATEIRSTGESTAGAMGSLGSFIAPYVVQTDVPYIQVGIVMLLVHFMVMFFVWGLPETKSRALSTSHTC